MCYTENILRIENMNPYQFLNHSTFGTIQIKKFHDISIYNVIS